MCRKCDEKKNCVKKSSCNKCDKKRPSLIMEPKKVVNRYHCDRTCEPYVPVFNQFPEYGDGGGGGLVIGDGGGGPILNN